MVSPYDKVDDTHESLFMFRNNWMLVYGGMKDK